MISSASGTLTFNAIAYPVTAVQVTRRRELAKFATSLSAGWKTGAPGSRDWGGTCSMRLGTAPAPPQDVSATLTITHTDHDGTGLRTYTGAALLTQVDIVVNVDTGEAIAANVTFEGLGALTETSS